CGERYDARCPRFFQETSALLIHRFFSSIGPRSRIRGCGLFGREIELDLGAAGIVTENLPRSDSDLPAQRELYTARLEPRHRALHVDRAAGVLDDQRGKTELARVERRPRHAKIGREPADEHALDAALLEVALEAGARLAVGLEKSRVAVHVPVVALPQDELRVGNA